MSKDCQVKCFWGWIGIIVLITGTVTVIYLWGYTQGTTDEINKQFGEEQIAVLQALGHPIQIQWGISK